MDQTHRFAASRTVPPSRCAIPDIPPIHPLHPRRWTPLRLRVFLITLGATGSVDAAARTAGMSRQSAYRLRARRPDIARVWDMALRVGHGIEPSPTSPRGDAG